VVSGAGIIGKASVVWESENIYRFSLRSKPHFDIDLTVADRFLAKLAPNEPLTFQTFDDSPQKRPALSKIRHGSLDQHAAELIRLNQAGAGIFVMVNRGDGTGRRAKNVVDIRAMFVDLDGAPLEPVLASEAAPHLVVESSHGRFHAYWIVDGCSLDKFGAIQKALAARFNGDPTVHDVCRVMRIPGFRHQKAAPFRSSLIIERANVTPYRIGALISALRLRDFAPKPRAAVAPAPWTPSIRCPLGEGHIYGRTALEKAASAIAGAPNGQQQATLNRECFGVGQLVAAQVIPEALARSMLLRAAEKMATYDAARPWLQQQVERVIDRAFADARRSPRGVPE